MRGNYYVYILFWNYVSSDATIMVITNKALAMLEQRVASSSNAWGARLTVRKGGCGGYTYDLSYAETPSLNDVVYHNILVVDLLSTEYLEDAEMDWVVTGLNEEFRITNNKESGRCGCGESFYI
jgi:iron-sulfur cluster assembly protein|tara:strand:+ start:473 stop:844 length:372 start_codon:yes stop_codon:yes gene_type:complete